MAIGMYNPNYIPKQSTTDNAQGYLTNYNTLSGLVPEYNTEAQKTAAMNEITKNYNDLVKQTMEGFDKRGMLGSGAFADYMAKNVNYGLGQGLASYQGQAEQNANAYNLQKAGLQQTAMQNLLTQQRAAQESQLKQDQFNQQMAYNQQKTNMANQLAQEQMRQQKIQQNRAAGRPDWWQ